MRPITADEAGQLIKNDATIFLDGLAMISFGEEILKGIEYRFLESGHPRNLTTWVSRP